MLARTLVTALPLAQCGDGTRRLQKLQAAGLVAAAVAADDGSDAAPRPAGTAAATAATTTTAARLGAVPLDELEVSINTQLSNVIRFVVLH